MGGSPAVVLDIGGGSIEVTLGTAVAFDARAELQARRHPADGAVHQIRPPRRARRAPAGQAHQQGDRGVPRRHQRPPVRSGDRDLRDDSQPWRARAGRGRLPRTGRPPQSARAGEGDPPAPEAAEHLGSGGAPPHGWPGSAPRRHHRGGVRAARHRAAPARRARDHALRPGAARRARPRLHPSQQRDHPQDRALSRRPAPQHLRTGRAVRVLRPRTRGTSRSWPWRFSTRRGPSTGWRTASGNGSSTPRCCTIPACTSVTSATIGTRYYLIKNGELRGFDPQEIEIIALLARYHRQATPKKSHDGYGALRGSLRKTVRTLAAMLRLAEGLDRSHAQIVTALDVVPKGNAFAMRLRVAGDAELEVWAGHRHAAPLEDVLRRPLEFEVLGRSTRDTRPGREKKARASHADKPDHAARVPGKAVRRGRHRRIGQDDAARAAR